MAPPLLYLLDNREIGAAENHANWSQDIADVLPGIRVYHHKYTAQESDKCQVEWKFRVTNTEVKKLTNTAIGEEAMLREQKEDIRISGEIPGTRGPKHDSTEEEEED